jgi:hypothetical protein
MVESFNDFLWISGYISSKKITNEFWVMTSVSGEQIQIKKYLHNDETKEKMDIRSFMQKKNRDHKS